ncbi:MAG: hypothetical protein H8D32_03955 [Dehalococcoidia bacterium]|nr:hypothetical protein [Dehalococcoidia bacterium]
MYAYGKPSHSIVSRETYPLISGHMLAGMALRSWTVPATFSLCCRPLGSSITTVSPI